MNAIVMMIVVIISSITALSMPLNVHAKKIEENVSGDYYEFEKSSKYEISATAAGKIRNSPIHAIVFEQKEPKDDTGMYQIFERINTSGRSLKPQEIRNCVYHGAFKKLLIELNKNQYWRKIYNDVIPDARMTDIELILRLFAFAYFSKQKKFKLTW